MVKFILFLVVLCGLAFGFAQLAETDGNVAIAFGGTNYEMPIAIAFLIVLALFTLVLIAFWILKSILKAPKTALRAARERKKRKGYAALSNGLLAVSAGDAKTAEYHAKDALRLLPNEPLSLLLSAQSQQMQGNISGAETSFRQMLERPETKLIGLKGLHYEADRRGDIEAKRQIAEDAVRISSSTEWAANSLLKTEIAAGDFDKALQTVEKQYSARLIDKNKSKRLRAVILTAKGDKDSVLEALGYAPELIPAVNLAAKYKYEAGEDKKALKLLENLWKIAPNRETALLIRQVLARYPEDKLKRAKAIAGNNEQSAWLVARIALDSNDFIEARNRLTPYFDEPRRSICLLMAELEMKETGDHGKSREWTSRALNAKPDFSWMCDGLTYDNWQPTSPITGEIDCMDYREPHFTSQILIEAEELPHQQQKDANLNELDHALLSLPHPPDDPGLKQGNIIKRRFF